MGHIPPETHGAGVVDRPGGRGRVQHESKRWIGRLELLPAIRERAVGDAIHRTGTQQAHRVQVVISRRQEPAVAELIFDLQIRLLAEGTRKIALQIQEEIATSLWGSDKCRYARS